MFLFFVVLLAAPPAGAQTFYEDNPTYQTQADKTAWVTKKPAAVGLDEKRLETAAAELEKLPFSFSLLIVRHDAIALERYFHGSKATDSNNVHSASKAILDAAVGIAIGQKRLQGPDQRLRDLLPAAPKAIRLKDLLTMRSGLRWKEDSTEYRIEKEPNWVRAMLELPLRNQPGEKFRYATCNTHLLSAALASAVHESTAQFTQENLFDPLGVHPAHWGHDPQGISSGGYNLYLTPRELAKFGLLYLHEGKWRGRQVVPAQWVKASLAKQTKAGRHYDYGYGFWEKEIGGYRVPFAWGFGGQMLYLVPKLDLLVVITTNTHGAPDPEPDPRGGDLLGRLIIPAAQP